MLPNNPNEPIYSCKLTCDKVRRVITSQLTISSSLVTPAFPLFPSTSPLSQRFITLLLSHPSFFFFLTQGRRGDLRQTAASETG